MARGPQQVSYEVLAYRRGAEAALLGREPWDNPYSIKRPWLRSVWARGYREASRLGPVVLGQGGECRAS